MAEPVRICQPIKAFGYFAIAFSLVIAAIAGRAGDTAGGFVCLGVAGAWYALVWGGLRLLGWDCNGYLPDRWDS